MARTRGANGIVKPARKLEGLLPTATETLPTKRTPKKEKQTKFKAESSAKKDKTCLRKDAAKLSAETGKPRKTILRLNPPQREDKAKEPSRSTKKQTLKLNPPKGPAPETSVAREKQDKNTKFCLNDLPDPDLDSPYAPTRPLPVPSSVTSAASGGGNIPIQPAPETNGATRATGAVGRATVGLSAHDPATRKEKAGKKTEKRSVPTGAAKKAGRPKKYPAPDRKRGRNTGIEKSHTKTEAQTADGSWSPPPLAPDHLLIRPTQAEIYKRYSCVGYTNPCKPARQSKKAQVVLQSVELGLGPEPRPRTPSPPPYSPITPAYNSVRHTCLPPPPMPPNRVVKPKQAGQKPTISRHQTGRASSAPAPRNGPLLRDTIDGRPGGYARDFSEDLDVSRPADVGYEGDEERSPSWSQKVQEAFYAVVAQPRLFRRK